MQTIIRKFDGSTETGELEFHATDPDGTYVVVLNSVVVGRVRKAEERTPVYGRGRIAVGHNVTKGWKALDVRYASVRKTRLAAAAELLDGVSTIERAS